MVTELVREVHSSLLTSTSAKQRFYSLFGSADGLCRSCIEQGRAYVLRIGVENTLSAKEDVHDMESLVTATLGQSTCPPFPVLEGAASLPPCTCPVLERAASSQPCTCPVVEGAASPPLCPCRIVQGAACQPAAARRPPLVDVLIVHFRRRDPAGPPVTKGKRTLVPARIQLSERIAVGGQSYAISGIIVRFTRAEFVGHAYSLVRRGTEWFVINDESVFPISFEDVQRTCLGGICTPDDRFVPSCSDYTGLTYCVHSAYYVREETGKTHASAVTSSGLDPKAPLPVESSLPSQSPSKAPGVGAHHALGPVRYLLPEHPQYAFSIKWILACSSLLHWLVCEGAQVLLASDLSGKKRSRAGTPTVSPQGVPDLLAIAADLAVYVAARGDQWDGDLTDALTLIHDYQSDAFSRAFLLRISAALYANTPALYVKNDTGAAVAMVDAETRGSVVSTSLPTPQIVFDELVAFPPGALADLTAKTPDALQCIRALGVTPDAEAALRHRLEGVELRGDTRRAVDALLKVTAQTPLEPLACEVGLGLLSSCKPASGAVVKFIDRIRVRAPVQASFWWFHCVSNLLYTAARAPNGFRKRT